MKKIKILFYSHTIDYGGTWRSHERILLNLNPDLFDVYVCYNPNQDNNRLDYLKTKLEDYQLIPFKASIDKLGSDVGYPYRETNFTEIVKSYNFDIIHFARSGYFEWPFNQRICPIQLETNIFGGKDNSEFLDCSVTICNKINEIRGNSDYIIYNPIPLPLNSKDNLISELNIPEGFHIFGRIGRKDNFHPITLNSLKKLKDSGFKIRKAQQELGLENNPNKSYDLTPTHYQRLAIEAYNRELITEGAFAHFLGVDRLEARRLAEILREPSQELTEDYRDIDLTKIK
jgi:hypothetical protein